MRHDEERSPPGASPPGSPGEGAGWLERLFDAAQLGRWSWRPESQGLQLDDLTARLLQRSPASAAQPPFRTLLEALARGAEETSCVIEDRALRLRWIAVSRRDASGELCAVEGLVLRERFDPGMLPEGVQAVIDAHPARLFWKDRDLRFLGCNAPFARDAGFEHPRELVGRDDFDMGWREQAESYRADDLQVMQSGQSKLGYEEMQTTPEGEITWLRTSKMPLRSTTGEIIGVVGTYEDITREVRARQEALHRAKLEAVGRLAGGVAHDFNNLLTVIMGNLELVRDWARDEDDRAILGDIETATTKASELTWQLLTFGRRQVVQPRLLDLDLEIGRLLPLVRRGLGETVQVAFTPGAKAHMVELDPGQFEQLVVTLALSARDAMPAGGTLTIATAPVSKQGAPWVRLCLQDEGPGLSEDAQAHIFEPFYRSEGAERNTGLGLATCHGIVSQNGGTIEVLCPASGGTAFVIDFPAAFASKPSAAPREPPTRATEQQRLVLLIEDEPAVRKLCARGLAAAGLQVLEAEDGERAVAVGEANPGRIDLILTDVVLPDLRGPEIVARLRATQPRAKVVYVSGYTEDALARDGVLPDDLHFLAKPYTLTELRACIARALGQEPAS